jgi:hypothetical protein
MTLRTDDQIQSSRLMSGGTGSRGAAAGDSSKAKRMVFPSLYEWVIGEGGC